MTHRQKLILLMGLTCSVCFLMGWALADLTRALL